jgi:putative membrane protein
MRLSKQTITLFFKGIAMGAADAVPGVSGGTIAFISGIYPQLIKTISGLHFGLLKTLKNQGFKAFWHEANGNFLLTLVAGILVSFVSLMRLAKYLIEQHPIWIWSFFFGLIVASVVYMGRQVERWDLRRVISFLAGTFLAFYLTQLPSYGGIDQAWFLFLAGALAICAMILPGISGSFILVILGAYKTLSDALHDFDFQKIILFMGGAVVGLLSFSRVLRWLFNRYQNTTLALLTGFVLGSLNKIWPWKYTQEILERSTGLHMGMERFDFGTLSEAQRAVGDFESFKALRETSILPREFAAINPGVDPELLPAIIMMVIGILVLFGLEYLGREKDAA